MEIRFATDVDLELIGNLYVDNHKKTYVGLLSDEYLNKLTSEYGITKWKNFLATKSNRLFVAYEGDKFLGFAACSEDTELEGTWYLDSLHVSEFARGKGIGTALIKSVGKYALDNNYSKMSICIIRGNDNAGTLYQKLGAKHYKYFEDDFAGTISQSEKLLWNNLNVFK